MRTALGFGVVLALLLPAAAHAVPMRDLRVPATAMVKADDDWTRVTRDGLKGPAANELQRPTVFTCATGDGAAYGLVGVVLAGLLVRRRR